MNLEPETSEQYSLGVVIQPSNRFSFSVDYWNIAVDNTIGTITIPQLLANIAAFPDRIQRTNGIITGVDLRTGNFGSRRTEGLDFTFRGAVDAFGGVDQRRTGRDLSARQAREAAAQSLPYTDLIGVFTFTGDLGLRWKHNAFISFTERRFSVTLTQIFRNGYRNFALPASATRPDYNPRVDDYIIYNFAISYTGVAPGLRLTFGIRNLFDRDPPFAITYDSNTGAGSSWEPRVADPRGRSFTMAAEVNF